MTSNRKDDKCNLLFDGDETVVSGEMRKTSVISSSIFSRGSSGLNFVKKINKRRPESHTEMDESSELSMNPSFSSSPRVEKVEEKHVYSELYKSFMLSGKKPEPVAAEPQWDGRAANAKIKSFS